MPDQPLGLPPPATPDDANREARKWVNAVAHDVLARALDRGLDVRGQAVGKATDEDAGRQIVIFYTEWEPLRVTPAGQLADPPLKLTPLMRRIRDACLKDVPLSATKIARKVGKHRRSSYVRTLLARMVEGKVLKKAWGGYVLA